MIHYFNGSVGLGTEVATAIMFLHFFHISIIFLTLSIMLSEFIAVNSPGKLDVKLVFKIEDLFHGFFGSTGLIKKAAREHITVFIHHRESGELASAAYVELLPPSSCLVHYMATRTQYQGKGFGTKLLSSLKLLFSSDSIQVIVEVRTVLYL